MFDPWGLLACLHLVVFDLVDWVLGQYSAKFNNACYNYSFKKIQSDKKKGSLRLSPTFVNVNDCAQL